MSKTGYIYKLCCNDPTITDCYVGSTKNEKVRKNGHKTSCNSSSNKNYNLNVYQFIRDNGGWANWNMIRCEEYKFDERAELNARERYWLETLGTTLNKQMPTRTLREYYIDNREELLEKHNEYRKNNRKILNQKQKEYAEKNKEKLAKYKKEYTQKNKEKIAEKGKIKTTCECGSTFIKNMKARHLKTKKHKDYITSIPSLP